jgi:nitrite reductase/ring-hydroxylating ferredoxin subunit
MPVVIPTGVSMEFVRVAKEGDVPKGGMRGFTVKGKKILLADVGGKLFAVGAVCTHLGGPLDKGKLDGTNLMCPWHGSIFNVTTGRAIGGPARKDVEKFGVKVENGEILVGIE